MDAVSNGLGQYLTLFADKFDIGFHGEESPLTYHSRADGAL